MKIYPTGFKYKPVPVGTITNPNPRPNGFLPVGTCVISTVVIHSGGLAVRAGARHGTGHGRTAGRLERDNRTPRRRAACRY